METRLIEKKEFKPVTIELTFETLEELKEFELRMALYRKNLIEAAQKQFDLGCSHQHIKGQSSAIGIGKTRTLLHKLLDSQSYIGNPEWT